MEQSTKFSRKVFCEGMRDGFPIALGYFAVAFSLGIAARNAGLTPVQGFLASILNNASAGEYAAFTLIAAKATYWEVAVITLIANARYLLMSCALAQRFGEQGKPYDSFGALEGRTVVVTEPYFALPEQQRAFDMLMFEWYQAAAIWRTIRTSHY